MATVLFLISEHDAATRYSAYYSKLFSDLVVDMGHEVITVTDSDNNPDKARELLQEDIDFIIHSGHGLPRLVTLENRVPFLRPTARGDINLFSQRHSFFLTCSSGKLIIPAIARAGAFSTAGYLKEYIWTVDHTLNPETDRYSHYMFNSAFMYPQVLLQGGSVSEAYHRTIDAFDSAIEALRTLQRTSGEDRLKIISSITSLEHDRDNFVAYDGLTKYSLAPVSSPLLAAGLILASAIGASVLPKFLIQVQRDGWETEAKTRTLPEAKGSVFDIFMGGVPKGEIRVMKDKVVVFRP